MFRSIASKSVAAVSVSAILAACGSETVDNAKKGALNLRQESEIVGSWEAACRGLSLLDLSGKARLAFTPAGFTRTLTGSSNNQCSDRTVEVAYAGTYKLGEATANNVHPIDFKVDSVKVTAFTPGAASALSKIKFCGKEVWNVGEAVDLTQASTSTLCPLDDVPADAFDIIKVEDNRLYTGKIGLAAAPAKPESRPGSLGDVPYVRQ